MSLKITDHFEYSERLGVYDFAKESPKIKKLRSIDNYKEFEAGSLPLMIVSQRVYSDFTLWWVLACYNNIVEADALMSGNIRIPDLKDVIEALR